MSEATEPVLLEIREWIPRGQRGRRLFRCEVSGLMYKSLSHFREYEKDPRDPDYVPVMNDRCRFLDRIETSASFDVARREDAAFLEGLTQDDRIERRFRVDLLASYLAKRRRWRRKIVLRRCALELDRHSRGFSVKAIALPDTTVQGRRRGHGQVGWIEDRVVKGRRR